jgi:hypothetical protein
MAENEIRVKLDDLCAGYDRTAQMGLFPHDKLGEPLDLLSEDKDALRVAANPDHALVDRDQAIWSLVYRQTRESRTAELADMLMSVATEAKEDVLRRSASWALFKIGEVDLLRDSLRKDDSGNVQSWKQHLIFEAEGRTDWVDPRPIRAIDNPLGYGVTLPLTIHGLVVFRTLKEEALINAKDYRGYTLAWTGQDEEADAQSVDGRVRRVERGEAGYRDPTRPSAAIVPPGAYDWHVLPVGPVAQGRLVGDLTAAVSPDSYYDNLIIQKVCANHFDPGFDHVQGYLFKGMSRSLGSNAMAHYYSSRGPQPFYLSGIIGEASGGVIDVETQLTRHAETNIAFNERVPYPYVQSVRGLFYGPAHMNTMIARNPRLPLDSLLQIVRDPYANGWFFGEFRSVPVDVDGDGEVEINGMEMYTTPDGLVVDRRPVGRQPSFPFVR